MDTLTLKNIDLASILETLGQENLNWSILHIWVVSKNGSGLDVFKLEELSKSTYGFEIDLYELITLSKEFEQVYECTLVGVNQSNLMPKRSLTTSELKSSCEVIVETVDGLSWDVFMRDANLFDRLSNYLPNADS